MNLPRLFLILSVFIFGIIGIMALFKGGGGKKESVVAKNLSPVEVELEQEVRAIPAEGNGAEEEMQIVAAKPQKPLPVKNDEELPKADRIEELFRKVEPRLSVVETISYRSRVPWLQGRPAWISDYASHYRTSRHFIARSLNGRPDYFKQDVAIGDRFNVFRQDLDLSFYLVVDLSRSKMWFYYYDKGKDERVLLKSYDVGLGRVDSSQPSGLLTPLGKYSLGEKVAIYKKKQTGWFNGEKVEMVRVFGSRWIPFEKEIAGCTAPAKGLGIHGVPLVEDEKGELVENRECIGKYESDGCIRLAGRDIEEVFAIVLTKPTFVEIVRDFHEAKLPGKER